MSDRKCRVSLCMIVRDEQQNLAECLAPVADLFDEIVIVDTGSVDETKEIARRFTPHVYDFEWCDDFSAARNESLRHATGDWVFWLDADDRVRPEHIAALRELLNTQLDERQQVFLMDTVLVPAEPSGDTVIVTHLRLFRRIGSCNGKAAFTSSFSPTLPRSAISRSSPTYKLIMLAIKAWRFASGRTAASSACFARSTRSILIIPARCCTWRWAGADEPRRGKAAFAAPG